MLFDPTSLAVCGGVTSVLAVVSALGVYTAYSLDDNESRTFSRDRECKLDIASHGSSDRNAALKNRRATARMQLYYECIRGVVALQPNTRAG